MAIFIDGPDIPEMSIMCRHLPDNNRSGRLANFVRLAECLADLIYKEVYFTDIRSGTNEKLLDGDLSKFCLVCLAGPVVNNYTDIRQWENPA